MLPSALAPLASWPQFVVWRLENRPGSEKPTKVPYSPVHGRKASSTNPADWGTYEQAIAFQAREPVNGVGFVFTALDPFFFLDIDGALVNGAWSQLAQEMCARLSGAAVEVSQSGAGLHIIGSGAVPPEHANRNIPLGLEFYTKERFVALTGSHASGSVSADVSAALPGVVSQFFSRATAGVSTEWTTAPVPEWNGYADDGELLERALASGKNNAASVMGGAGDPTFADLFTANTDVLARKWPPNPNSSDRFDHSSVDQAFANSLAFWTGKDCERMERIMRLSALARAKWDIRETYLQDTILNATAWTQQVYVKKEDRPVIPLPPPPLDEEVEAAGFSPRPGDEFMLSGKQLDHFAGCIYVVAPNKVLIPGGDILDQARFDVIYGGHDFVISRNGKKVVSSAFEAFAKNQNFTASRADRLCFRPEYGAGGIIVDGGKRLANTYYPAETEETEGDPSPMINHIHKMLPIGHDAELLLTYMASVKQNPGMKAQWWPIVQGAEGNFKSFLLKIMAFAVGSHYSHMPNMEKMVNGKSNFNGWIDRKLFLGLDEVYATHRREFFEGFKTTVTNLSLPIEGKGIEEVTGDNRANGFIVTNWQDGVPITGKNRRYAAFFCAQQTPEDMVRDGMDAEYIRNLKDWLLGSGIYAAYGPNYGMRVMNWHLARKVLVAELDPAQLAIRCPDTSSTQAAIVAGRGRVEQEVQEAIEEERPGFAGGWVSSIYLDKLMRDCRHNVAFAKRREMMLTLGYDYHPALHEGRVNNPVTPDGGKPRIYVRVGSIQARNLTDAASVAKAYSDAQTRAAIEKSAAGQVMSK
jgi:hypothetical protein